jgi:opine dehydrogenase
MDSLADALREATVVLVVVPAFAHKRVALEIAPHVDERTILVLNPGRTGGALEVSSLLRKSGVTVPVAESQSLLFACRRRGDNGVWFGGVKKFMRLGVYPGKSTQEVMERLSSIIPHFRRVPDVRTTSFGNIGAVFHPTSLLLNVGIVQSGRTYDYYTETMAPAVVELIEKLDGERVGLARKVGAEVFDARSWLRESYGLANLPLRRMLTENPAYQGVAGPADIQARYITEDVPTGLVPMEAVARQLDVPTPTITAIISLAEVLMGEDYRATGRNLETLGLDMVQPADYDTFFQEGWN